MRTFSAAALAALETGRFRRRNLIVFDMPSAPFAVWDETYDATIDGQLHYGVANAIRVSASVSTADGAARNIDITVSGLDTAVAAQVEAQSWHQRGVTISAAIFGMDAPDLLHKEVLFSGFMDRMKRREKVGDRAELTISCESIQRELGRKGARTRSDADQRQIDPLDGFFKHVALVGTQEIWWGRLPPQSLSGSRTSSGTYR